MKTGWLADGKVQFHARSQHTNSKGNTCKPYGDGVDYFAVYCHELETLYLIGEDEFRKAITLRVDDPKVKNRRINWATDFESTSGGHPTIPMTSDLSLNVSPSRGSSRF